MSSRQYLYVSLIWLYPKKEAPDTEVPGALICRRVTLQITRLWAAHTEDGKECGHIEEVECAVW